MYHQINPTEMFRERELALLKELENRRLLAQAKESGNDPRVVRLSVHQAFHEGPTRISRQHAEIEDELRAYGLPYTFLRPQFFMQNTLATARTVASRGKIYQPFKDGKLGMIDARDIGEVAAKVLTEEGHEGKVYTLTGPAAISLSTMLPTR